MWDTLMNNINRRVALTDEEKEIISSMFTPRKYRKRQYILQEGDVSRSETFVLSGVTRTYEVDEKGQEHVVQFGIEDWWVGDMYSFLTETPTKYNIDCLEDCEVLQISKPKLETLYERVPKMDRYFRILVQNAYIASTNRIASTLTQPAADRYEAFILKYPNIEQRVPNHQIASYLGITPQSLSRIRAMKR